jgi:hypothetical protein
MKKTAIWCLSLILGLVVGLASVSPNQKAAAEPAAAQAVEASVEADGPFTSYAAARQDADLLEYEGYFTEVTYRAGAWWVLWW